MKSDENTNFKILVVDDNLDNIRSIGSVLRENSYKVGFAENGIDTLNILNQNSNEYDLILLDVNMPGMSGFDVCREIRRNDKLLEIPIIFLTANVDSESVMEGFSSGGQDYISKPFHAGEMLSRIKTHIELQESRKKLKNINSTLEELVKERTNELVEANLKLEKANKELEVLDNSKVEFLNLISHEINTPLNGILGFASILKDELVSTEYFDMIDALNNSAKRLFDFARTSLIITKIRTNPSEYDMRSIELMYLIEEVIFSKRKIISAKEIEVKLNTTTKNLSIIGNYELLNMCIKFIIDNSINYSSKNSIIEVDLSEENEKLVVQVRDHGTGFSDLSLAMLFKPFSPGEQHIDNNKGLSLYLVKLIADIHKAEVELKNAEDGGAIIRLAFESSKSK